MTFNRQILLFISSLVLVLFVGTFWLNLSNTKAFLQNQLTSHAEDAATSLGLSLSTVADLDNPASIEAMINAVFDRGHYRLIALHDVDDELIYQRQNFTLSAEVPDPFVSLFTIESPQANALVQAGWMPVGTLTVQANAGYAYFELWKAVKTLSGWFSLAALLALLLAFYMVRTLLKPLKKIEIQANAIVKKQYVYQEDLPSTLEFKTVVQAMNKMVSQLKDVFDREAKVADKLKRMTYQDSVTGLSNRRHFDMMLEAQLMTSEDSNQGSLLMLRVEGMKELNDQYGYQLGDAFMKRLANKLVTTVSIEEGVYARLSGLELIAILPSADVYQLQSAAQSLVGAADLLLTELNIQKAKVVLTAVLVGYESGDKRGNLLGRLEFGMKQLQALPGQQVMVLGSQDEAQPAKDETLRELVNYAFEHHSLKLYRQDSQNTDGQVHDTEVFVRMLDRDGSVRSAAYFMPAIERFNRLLDLDLQVIRLALAHQKNQTSKPLLSLNLSHSLLNDKASLDQLLSALDSAQDANLAFEFSDLWAVRDVQHTLTVMNRFRDKGFKVGIDSFGSRFTEMQYLQTIQPDYIKLDGAFSRRIESDQQTQSYVNSVCELANALDVPVIAMAIESEQQLEAFKQVGIHYFQGYLFGTPSPL